MGIHPYQLDRYTPAELLALLDYADAKREAMNKNG